MIHVNLVMANNWPLLLPVPPAKLTLAVMRYAQTSR